jgi:hypothetical protein
MTDPAPPQSPDAVDPVQPAALPPPLKGCLYCHAEGSTRLGESRQLLGLGASVPVITCSSCGSVAQYEAGERSEDWRVRYRNVNKAPRYYYVMIHLGQAGWLSAEEALEASRRGLVNCTGCARPGWKRHRR